jgi:hypothetical protein
LNEIEALYGIKKVLNNQAVNYPVTPTFWCAMNLLSCIIAINLSVGTFFLFDSQVRSMLTVNYGRVCNVTDCMVDFTPQYDLRSPVVYYSLDNFYMSHRTFAKSKSVQ